MRSSKKVLRTLYIYSLITSIYSFGEKKGIRVDRVECCGGSKNSPIKCQGTEIQYENLSNGAFHIISTRSEITRVIPILKISIEVQRCSSKESLDSCILFLKTNAIDACKLLNMKGAAWEENMKALEPRIECPVKPAVYTSKNSTFDPNLGFFFPLDNWYWKLEAKFIDGNEYMLTCFEFQVSSRVGLVWFCEEPLFRRRFGKVQDLTPDREHGINPRPEDGK